jgi:hypothetical protein
MKFAASAQKFAKRVPPNVKSTKMITARNAQRFAVNVLKSAGE